MLPDAADRPSAQHIGAPDIGRRPDAVLLYSHDTARRFAALLVEAGLKTAAFSPRYLCLSAAVAGALPDGAPVEVAARPDEESLFSLL
ncbi:hypothetical protein [Ensifer sp. 1H6]|uniref:hypothetical protein n=1 Tax=Ensifer sp. 1H6 TaxID=1911585 RepID=UPI001FDAB5E6|nr:hypothetical protein [Ensifer sp. 1H6]